MRIEAIGLGYLVRLPHTCTHMVMMIAMCEKWHYETMIIHLPTGEMIVTLEDVYQILILPLWGTPVMVMREMIMEVSIQELVGPRVEFRI